MLLKPGQRPVLIVNGCILVGFAFFFGTRQNYEFLMYIGVIVFFLGLVLATNRRVAYPTGVLWGLTLWAFLHMAGGSFVINGTLLYHGILVPVSAEYGIFRFDQFVHIVGFGVATLMMHVLLRPLLRADVTRSAALGIVVVMAGLGVGALNEIVEFAATVVVPETGVGGYTNTALDLVADLVGALLALGYLRLTGHRTPSDTEPHPSG